MFFGIKSYNTCSNVVFWHEYSPQSFCYSFIALSVTRCSTKSTHKFAAQVPQVTTSVAMETMQLVLRQFLKKCRSQ